MVDTKKLSPDAQKIFKKLKPYFPPDPWENACWKEDGTIRHGSTWFDLRKSSDRKKLEDSLKSSIGYSIYIDASVYKDKNKCRADGQAGWLTDFTYCHFSKSIQNSAELLLILSDLDYQIETQDMIDDYDDCRED